MKKSFILTLGLFVATAMTAKTEVSMYDLHGKPAGHNSCIPIVNSDGDDITIKSDSTIYNVDIVIRDQFGNVSLRKLSDRWKRRFLFLTVMDSPRRRPLTYIMTGNI